MLNIRTGIPLAPLTTFGIGGAARYLVDIKDETEFLKSLDWAKQKPIRFFILAGGSNVLIPDGGLSGLVIRFVEGKHSFDGSLLIADPGCNLLGLIREASQRNLGGWEKLSGIPGTIGGAVRGNAGAFGPEIKDFVTSVRAINTQTGESKNFSAAECDFSYRNSYLKQHPEWVVTKVTLSLSAINSTESKKQIEETIAEREKRHLQNVRAAGSFFMNPVAPQQIVDLFETEKGVKARGGRVPAGWLIEKAGLKGHKVGDAIASEQHPNYLVNTGNATAHDVRNLAQLIKLEVFTQFGVDLHEEAAMF